MKKIYLAIMLSLLAGCVHIQNSSVSPDDRFSPEALKSDLILLRSALEEAHPGLYDFCPQSEMNALFDRLHTSLTGDMTELQFLGRISELNGKIGCGHTAIIPSRKTRDHLMSTAGLFPCDVRIADSHIFVIRCYRPGFETIEGSEILTINGTHSPELLDRFMDVLPSDGYNITHKYAMLDERMRYYYAAFIDTPMVFELGLRSTDSTQRSVTLPAMAENAMRTHPDYIDPDGDDLDLYAFEISEETSSAVLTIRSFEPTEQYESFLADSFNELQKKKISYLIIDLRKNGGGEDEYGAKLVSYLVDQPFRYYRSLVARTDRIGFMAHTDMTRDDLLEFQKLLQRSEDGEFLVKPDQHLCLSEIQPTEPIFKGRVLVLIDGGSFSATTEAAAVLHFLRRAEFVGEETGGRYTGNNSGYMPMLTLPSTGIRAFIPLIQYRVAVDQGKFKGRGIIPDYPVEPLLQDEIDGTDRVMMETRAILNRMKEN